MPAEFRRPSSRPSLDPPRRTVKPTVLTLVRDLASGPEQERESAHMPSALLALRLAPTNPRATAAALSPSLEDSASAMALRGWFIQSLLLEAITRDAFGDSAAEQALAHALDLAQHDRVLVPFLVHPVPTLLERHAGRLTAHAHLIAEIFTLAAAKIAVSPPSKSTSLREPLTDSEVRVLRFLPTDLSTREIADELYLSVHTIKTHVKHLYAKLDVHSRREAVHRGRELGFLPQFSRNR